MRRLTVATPKIPPLWKHQKESLKVFKNQPRGLDLSDPGTAKTRVQLELFRERRRAGGGKALILAPKSLLRPAWANDSRKFTPDLKVSIAYSTNRKKAFEDEADIYITNVDAAKWLAEQKKAFFKEFDTLIIDELIAFKHRTSQRSKAMAKIVKYFTYRYGLNGTFTSGTVLDAWHQAFLIDDGERLGHNFFQFRSAVATAKQVGPSAQMVKWVDKPGANEAVAGLLANISVRHRLDEVLDIPPNYVRTVTYYPSDKLMNKYKELEVHAILQLQTAEVTAVNAAVLRNKLLQVASGAVYSGDENYHLLDTGRYELIADLAGEVDHSVIFFNWSHQKHEIANELDKRGKTFCILDGKTPIKEREALVDAYQAGELSTILLHPLTGAHGLTLTRGTRTIWSSPIYQPDFIKQGLHRIYRGGQTKRTETIMIEADSTVEAAVYEKLNDKHEQMTSLLEMLQCTTK